jgi:hypothetical protein
VLVRGRLAGPGAYGAGEKYRYQLVPANLEPLAVLETSVSDLLDQPASYEGRLVRVVGGLLVRERAGLLVDRLGPGGLPEPKARQIKLRAPLGDPALLGRLKGAAGGPVRFGQVQVEGFWRAGALAPISFAVVT